MRRNPFDELEEMLDRFGRQVEEGMGAGFPQAGSVAVDVAETDDEYVVTADLPGYETEDIDLTLSEGALRLEARRDERTSYEDEATAYVRKERTRQSVSRRIRLPEPVDEEGISAKYTNGVLTVTLPKIGGNDSRHIDIE